MRAALVKAVCLGCRHTGDVTMHAVARTDRELIAGPPCLNVLLVASHLGNDKLIDRGLLLVPGQPFEATRPEWCTCAKPPGGPYQAPPGYVAKFTFGAQADHATALDNAHRMRNKVRKAFALEWIAFRFRGAPEPSIPEGMPSHVARNIVARVGGWPEARP